MPEPDRSSLVDIHSHLVPGVDDGAADLPSALRAVGLMRENGIRRILTTPHIKGSLTLDPGGLERRLSSVSSAWQQAVEAIAEQYPDVQFWRGHEVLLDVPNVDFSDPRVRMAGTSFVLVEWPRLHIPPGTIPALDRMVMNGYRPIVAHPERYAGIGHGIEIAGQWRAVGAHLQVNYGSLVGRYGPDAQSAALRLLRRGWVDYLATDFHAVPTLGLFKSEAWRALEAAGAGELLVFLSQINPARVLSDEPPIPVQPLPREKGFMARLRDFLSPPA